MSKRFEFHFVVKNCSITTRNILAVTRGSLDLKCSCCTAMLAHLSKAVDDYTHKLV